MKTLLSIQRRPTGLSALFAKRTQSIELDQLCSEKPVLPFGGGLFDRSRSECAVDQISLDLYSRRDELLDAWNSLRSINSFGPRALLPALLVLRETECDS